MVKAAASLEASFAKTDFMSTGTKTNWIIDQGHSEIGFKIKHLAVSHVSGRFRSFKGTVESDGDDFTNSAVRVEIEVDSIDTNNSQRDEHLKSSAFFDAGRFPTITFDGAIQKEADSMVLAGNLTMLETTRSTTFQVEQTGSGVGRFGDQRAGFEVTGRLNRKDFGLAFSMLTETGSLIVGEEVKLHFDIQLVLQP